MPLSTLTDRALKQVLPFRISIDSISDLVSATSEKEVKDRLMIMRDVLGQVGGNALIGAPIGSEIFLGLENYLFDAIIETVAVRKGSTWERILTLTHLRNSTSPPQQWTIGNTSR
jgi:hypothetical protein